MAGLWQTLEYDQIAFEVVTGLATGDRLQLLEGPPGVGKSWLARGIGALWEEGGGSAIIAEGDLLSSDFDYYPFGYAMSGLPAGWKRALPGVAGVTRAAEALVGTAGLVTSTVQALAKARSSRQSHKSQFLGEREQSILAELEKLSKRQPILLIADNLHWWDGSSLRLLARLMDPRLQQGFPFLAELRVLAVQTPEPYQQVADTTAHKLLTSSPSTNRIQLPRVPRDNFGPVLEALGAPTALDAHVVDAVYALSGGNLALAARAASRMADADDISFLEAADGDEFLRTLLLERMHALGNLGQRAFELLHLGAVLGLAFRREEALCASADDDAETARLLHQCREEELISVSGGTCRFVHDTYRQFFLELGTQSRADTHARLAECLQTTRPAEYELRSINAIRAGLDEESARLGVQAAFQKLREGLEPDDLAAEVLTAIANVGLDAVIASFAHAFRLHLNHDHIAAIRALEQIPRALPEPILAELDWLRAACRLSTRSEEDRALGRELLQGWSGFEDIESELGVRLARLHLYGLSHLADKGLGRSREAELKRHLTKRVAFDPSAEDDLYTLDRCAGSLYQPDVALIRNEEAVRHFSPTAGSTVVRRPLEYYRCLSNFGANLIASADYLRATTVYETVEQLVASFGPEVFPRLEFPRSNAVLAAVRSETIALEVAIARQRDIFEEVDGDPYYPGNALAVYLALNEEFDESVAVFDRLVEDLHARQAQPESSMVYLLESNRCVARYLSGDALGIESEWQRLATVAESIAYVIRPFLLRRHELLWEAMVERRHATPAEFDEHLPKERPAEFGPLWDNLARSMRIPEVEFWRDN